MLFATVTTKGQATIPAKVRDELSLKPGDKIVFLIRNHKVTVSKAEPFDYLYHTAISSSLSEWDSPEDDEAYNDL